MRKILLPVCLVMLIAGPAFAQQSGQINGVVTDTSGGVVPGVTVTATEVATGLASTTVTGENGRYSFPSLRPTEYTITAEISGFRTYKRQGVVLLANQNLTVAVSLELGELAETVTVAGAASQVDITTATISEVVDHARIVELPIAGREIARLQTLVAGTVVESISNETGKSLPGAVRISSNGAGARQNAYRLDGASNTDPYFQENQSFPFPDAVQEFSIQTSNYSAAHGGNAGAVVNVVTRSGTNDFHGGGFEYLRDRAFNARGFFAKEKDFLKRNQYGGFAGGPILHNKLFFFTGYQRTRITNKEAELIRFVPTLAQRNGDFSNCSPACPQLFNPATGQAFPNNQIPVSLFDPSSALVLKQLPIPDNAEGRVTVPRSTGQTFNQFVAKIDHQLSNKNQLSMRYFIDDFFNEPQFVPGNILSYTSPSLQSDPRSQNIVGTWKRTMSAVLLNEFTFGYNRLHTSRRPHPDVPAIQDFGVRLPYLPTSRSISEINANGYFNIGDNLEASFPRDGFQFNNRTSWVKVRHSFMFGAEIEYLRPEIYNQFRRAGHFVFDGRFTRAPGASSGGNALADFLLGRMSTFDHGTGEYKNYRALRQSYYFNDEFKASDHITLNMGARYEPDQPWHDEVGRFQYFTMDAYNQGLHSKYINAPAGLLFRGDPGVPEDGSLPDMNNVSARLGFAWDISGDGKMSLRGGGGMFYDTHLQGDYNNDGVNSPPWSIRVSVTEPVGPFSDPYRGRTDFDAVKHEYEDKDEIIGAVNAPFPRPVNVNTFDGVFNTPLTYNYNLTFEREILAGWMARAGYVGSTATSGRSSLKLNPAIYVPGGPTGNPDARRALPEYGEINQYVQNRDSQYHSMQVSVNRRYSNGFTLSSNYTLADLKGTIDGPELVPYFHPQYDQIVDTLRYGRLDTFRRHRFVTSWVYSVPGPKSGLAGATLGGWEVSGFYQWQSGQPFTIVSGRDNAGWGLGSNRAMYVAGQSYDPPAGSDPTLWFNPAAFAVNPNGSFGETKRGEYFGPSRQTVDLGLFKSFRFTDAMNLQFRAEFFNLFNTVNFNNPGTTVATAATFGRITAAQDPRIMQFGLKMVF